MNSSNSRKMRKCRTKKCEEVWHELVLEQPLNQASLNQACHYASLPGGLDVVERLIERCPKFLTMACRGGYLPLHCICRCSSVTLDLVQLFVSNFPNSVKAKTKRNETRLHVAYDQTPLHIAVHVQNRLSLDVIQFLIEQYPGALLEQDDEGWTPLHYACHNTQRDRLVVIQRLMEQCPKALTVADMYGRLPLHLICYSSKVTLDLVQLFQNCPDSVRAKTEKNLTPLHLAVENRSAFDVIQFLYQQYPEALLDQDNEGWTPLHFACQDNHRPEVLQTVYHPRAARMQTPYYDLTPLHVACDARNETVVQFLLEKDPALLLELHLRNNHRGDIDDENECYQIAALSLLRELVNKHKQSPKKMKQNVMAVYLGRLLETRPYPTLKQLDSLAPSITLKVSPDQIYRELKDMLYKRTFRELLKVHRNMIRINQSGYLREDPGNKAKCVAVLASTAGGANKISNVHLLFQQLRENTLLCNRLPSPLLFSNKKEQQEQQKPRRSKRLRKENQQEEQQQITKRSKRKSKVSQQQEEEQQTPRRSKRKTNENSTTTTAKRK